jgi:hypothetical protein
MVVLMKSFLLAILIFVVSCTQEVQQKQISLTDSSSEYSQEIKGLIKDNEIIQYEIAQNNIFQNASVHHVNLFRQFILRSRRYLVMLLGNTNIATAALSLKKEIVSVENLPIAIRDQSYILPYIKALKVLVAKIDGSLSFYFNGSSLKDILQVQSSETATLFKPRSNSHGPYLGVDSFKEKNDGTVSLITPVIKLKNINYKLKFQYLVRFYAEAARQKELIKFYIGENKEEVNAIEWQKIETSLGPDASNFGDPPSYTSSESIKLTNTEIRIKVEYTSLKEESFFPAFNIYNVQFEEDK